MVLASTQRSRKWEFNASNKQSLLADYKALFYADSGTCRRVVCNTRNDLQTEKS